ncbi:uracil-DNA glycosylase [Sulfitobacter sp. KE29]|uniref:uracil-DNA glycosylase n=1 Tax=Sulfitobacter TaxID=60136 RepID=UPI0007C394F6|nr:MULTISPECIES: uracil-DNA glycosylase [Sulfitobacter]KZY54189.1 uracil-DNA glycosylase [Sulfitobacter sp. HI0054]MBO9437687.1 uracil-DNA glycosylase [Sulfitobacter sp. R18_2]MDF3417130.1 uracil-DNA glycosylase [Sulfitobacter sp. Ks38]MDF3424612.1 uracil-DNA glycosylase [Sulfitobacter sp. KE29]MDF3428192.1 uracil-DNA glycosylase [Sulfitobacter sp. S46]
MTLPSLTALGAWAELPFFAEDWPRIAEQLAAETRVVLPPAPQIFAALEHLQPAAVEVVILGQDPYPTPGHAHGYAFSAEPDVRPIPRSLANIFKELDADLGASPQDPDLRFWADQGVLLLNNVLTVPAGCAHGHARLGWRKLTAQVLNGLSDRPRAYLLWGAHAQKAAAEVDPARNLKIETPHPSPLSARRGFFGSRPFSRVNDWLQGQGKPGIHWTKP